jgi:hypothetical protein
LGSQLGEWSAYDGPVPQPMKYFRAYGKKFYMGSYEDDQDEKNNVYKLKGANKNYEKLK